MNAQLNKKTAPHIVQATALTSIKLVPGAPTIAPDSDKQISYWRDQAEDFLTELSKLRCLSGLLNGQTENNSINLAELCLLIDPSVDRLKEICDELSEIFNQKQVMFLQPSGEQSSNVKNAINMIHDAKIGAES